MHMNESKLTEFVSAILEFQNPSVEFETEKKFRFWFDGAQNWALFCAQLLVEQHWKHLMHRQRHRVC